MKFHLASRKLPLSVAAARIYEALFMASPYAFWLDSSRHEGTEARFSFLGASDSPEAYRLEGFADGRSELLLKTKPPEALDGDIFAVVEERLREITVLAEEALPFEFHGGFVGYIGYELMALTEQVSGHKSAAADATLLFVDRFVAIDHASDELYLLALYEADRADAEAWFATVEETLNGVVAVDNVDDTVSLLFGPRDVEPFLLHDKAAYFRKIASAKQKILEGESYEICLTNRVRLPLISHTPAELFRTYLTLRRINPAPYACLLRFGPLSVLSSSPERFLKISSDGMVETKPIKGTTRRSADRCEDEANRRLLLDNEKFFSENLMIVDLLRNDLSRSCKPGSIHVPSLMHVESYATVHQLVSTIRGVLDKSPIQCVTKCFPGGSMTGAPKKRTLEIIHELEGSPRGVYSGAIGYFSLNGAVDLNIVIRTAVVHGGIAEIGVGGAIIHLSDAEEEYDEMILKALAPVSALSSLIASPVAEYSK